MAFCRYLHRMEASEALIDREYLSDISGGDTDFEKELIQAFIDAAPDLIKSFVNSVGLKDQPQAVYSAHTLKGSSRSIGACRFAVVVAEAEHAAREGDMKTCATLAPRIEQSFNEFLEAGTEFLAAA